MELQLKIHCQNCNCSFCLNADKYIPQEEIKCPCCWAQVEPETAKHIINGLTELSKVGLFFNAIPIKENSKFKFKENFYITAKDISAFDAFSE